MNKRLKIALLDYREPAWRVAKQAGIPDSKLSKIVNGYILPSEDEMNRLAHVLGREPEELFPETFGKESKDAKL